MFGDLDHEENNQLPFLEPNDQPLTHETPLIDGEKKGGSRGRPKGEKNGPRKKDLPKTKDGNSNPRSTGHWSPDQNRKYHWFLELYSNHFLNKHLRRTDKIFKTMEVFLGTREAEQCRSHHQKMQKKHKSFQQILIHLRTQYYGTCDHTPVAQDLSNNNIQLLQSLVRGEHLHQNNQIDKEQSHFNNQIHLQLQEESKAVENIFSDKYQMNMDIRFL